MYDEAQPVLGQLIYVSSATRLMSKDELVQLLTRARDFNQLYEVTGMLVYSDGTFIQVLEGNPEVIEDLYRHIERDPRHHRCIVLLRQIITERAFEGWSMGFRSTSPAEVESIVGYVDFFDNCPVPDKGAAAYRLLSSFYKQHERDVNFAA